MLSRGHRRPGALDPAEPLGATLYAFVGAALFEAARFAAEHVSVTVTLF
ncbi:hypothetical protein IPZ70_05935 [Streptomyces polychromogenes]|nr:hypothetical protein [Streptomyces polychromogenes]